MSLYYMVRAAVNTRALPGCLWKKYSLGLIQHLPGDTENIRKPINITEHQTIGSRKWKIKSNK